MLFVMLSKIMVPLDMELFSFMAYLVFSLIPVCFHSEATLKDFSGKKKVKVISLEEGKKQVRKLLNQINTVLDC